MHAWTHSSEVERLRRHLENEEERRQERCGAGVIEMSSSDWRREKERSNTEVERMRVAIDSLKGQFLDNNTSARINKSDDWENESAADRTSDLDMLASLHTNGHRHSYEVTEMRTTQQQDCTIPVLFPTSFAPTSTKTASPL